MKIQSKMLAMSLALLLFFQVLPSQKVHAWADWAKDDVRFLIENGMIDVSMLSEAGSKITRGEFAYIGVRLYEIFTGEDAQRGDAYFSDTYDDYVLMAKNHKIVSGYEDGSFKPDQHITRQELSVLFVNVLNAVKKANSLGEYEKFADDSVIANWAKDQVYTCRKYHIVTGMGDNMFMPKESATVEQALVMFKRMVDTFSDPEYMQKFGDVPQGDPNGYNGGQSGHKDDSSTQNDPKNQNQGNSQSNPNANQQNPNAQTQNPQSGQNEAPANVADHTKIFGEKFQKNSALVGKKAIAFSATTSSNQSISFAAAKKSVLHFYSSDLSANMDTLKILKKLSDKNSQISFFFLDLSGAKNPSFRDILKRDLKIDPMIDSNLNIYTSYGLEKNTFTIFVDGSGVIKSVIEGNTTFEQYQKQINEM